MGFRLAELITTLGAIITNWCGAGGGGWGDGYGGGDGGGDGGADRCGVVRCSPCSPRVFLSLPPRGFGQFLFIRKGKLRFRDVLERFLFHNFY